MRYWHNDEFSITESGINLRNHGNHHHMDVERAKEFRESLTEAIEEVEARADALDDDFGKVVTKLGP